MTYLKKKTIRDINVNNKRVIVRVDFNVPCKNGIISDDTRIVAALPTIQYLLDKGASIILMSHMGRPKGKRNMEYSLAPVAKRLADVLGRPVRFAEDCVGEETAKMAAAMKPGDIMLLENLRFHPEEEKNDPEFAKALADLADIYVDDAFGSAHRAHASTVGIASFLPAVCGLLIEKEIVSLGKAVSNPARPFVVIMGGAKVSDKISVIENLLTKVDSLLIGGGMANTFFAAQGYNMQASKVEEDKLDLTRSFLSSELAERIQLPLDVIAASSFDANAEHIACEVGEIPEGWMALDIGPKTVDLFKYLIRNAATVVWNGPLGVFEMDAFAEGTMAIARAVADSPAFSVIGGGDSVSAVNKAGVSYRIDHVSTGGGASLEFLEGKILPGIDVLEDKYSYEGRRPLYAANWKMNMDSAKAAYFVDDLRQKAANTAAELVILPPSVYLSQVAKAATDSGIRCGIQNIYWENSGPFTGEVSSSMAKDCGADYVLCGHSERRHIFGETADMVALKAASAQQAGLIPMVCVGETIEQRQAGKTMEVLKQDIQASLAGVTPDAQVVIAYEPVWAIGTGLAATAADAEAAIACIRQEVEAMWGELAEEIRILYGGSVNASNIAEFMTCPNIDGVMVGGASLQCDSFVKIIENGEK